MRTVVYVLVLLVVIGMILTMVGSALATAASPTSANAFGAPHADQSPRPTPVVVLGTHNLTWSDLQDSDLQDEVSRTSTAEDLGSSDVGPAAAHLLAFASENEPVNLAVRTPAERTCPADGWLTLGRGARASAVRPTGPCPGLTVSAAPGGTSPLVRALGRGRPVITVGPGARLVTGSPEGSASAAESPVSSATSLPEALSADADLIIVDTAEGARTDAERVSALDAALRTVQEQAAPGTRIVVASLADDEDPGPQMAVLPAGSTNAHGTSGGLVVGTSTHRSGLAQLTDLAPTLTTALIGRSDRAFDGQALDLPTTGGDAGATTSTTPSATAPDDARITRLADDALHARASQLTALPMGAVLAGSAAVLLAWAALVLRDPGPGRRPGGRRRVVRAATGLSALPTALLLVNAVPWWRAGARDGSPSPWVLAVALAVAVAVAACIVALAVGLSTLVRQRQPLRRVASPSPVPAPSPSSSVRDAAAVPDSAESTDAPPSRGAPDAAPQQDEAGRPPPPSSSPLTTRAGVVALLVAAAIPLTWLADAAGGAHLAFNNPLGMNAVVAGRFYGVSNTAFALAAGALVVVIAASWETLGRGRRTALGLTGLLGGAALVVDGAPQLGADVGGALSLVPTLAFLGAVLAGLRLSWRRRLAIAATTLLVVGSFAVIDLIRPGGPTHLGRFARQVADGSAAGVVGRKAYALVGPIVSTPTIAAALGCASVLVVVAVWWVRRQLRVWRAGTSPYAWLAPAPTVDGDISRVGGPESRTSTREMSPSTRWETTALRSLGVLTVVSVLVNDSGVTMAGFILAAAAPALLALTLIGSGSSPQPLEACAEHRDVTP